MSSSHQPLLSSNSNSSSSPTSLCTLLDVLTVPDILARLCCDYLEPRDILTLGLISKRVKVLIDTNPSIWHKMSTAFLGQEVLDKASVVPSSKESFLRLYKLERYTHSIHSISFYFHIFFLI